MDVTTDVVSSRVSGGREVAGGFEAFFADQNARLFGALCAVTGDRHEAEEIAQDAFLKIWERWETVSSFQDPIGYLYRTATWYWALYAALFAAAAGQFVRSRRRRDRDAWEAAFSVEQED